MTIPILSWQNPFAEHPVPGATPVSSQRLQAPAGHHGPVLTQAIEHGSSGQSAIISGFHLSAISGKAFPAKPAAPPNPHRRPSATAFPRVRSSEAFRLRPLYGVDRSRRAGIRNPSRKPTFKRLRSTGGFAATATPGERQREVPIPLTHSPRVAVCGRLF